MMPVLDMDIAHRLGEFSLAAKFVSEGRVTALFGPSGSGKTTLVNAIAGLIRPERARIVIDGEVLVDTANGVFVPKHRRRIGYVFQDARLFPHLDVRSNLLFGHWFRREGSGDAARLGDITEMLGIAGLLGRRPGTLSGGERQRVAIGRALLANPRVLLMDEPLAALDDARKAEIMPYLERLRDDVGIPIIYVSHAVREVCRLATHVAVMAEGAISACGPVAEVLARLDVAGRGEASAIIEARVVGQDARDGLTRLQTRAGIVEMVRTGHHAGLAEGSALRLRILASDVLISLRPPEGLSALNVFQGVIVEMGGHAQGIGQGIGQGIVDLRLDCGGAVLVARITARSAAQLGLEVGLPVSAIVKSVAIE